MTTPDPLCLYCYTRKPSTVQRYNRQWKCCDDCAARNPPDVILDDWLDTSNAPKPAHVEV